MRVLQPQEEMFEIKPMGVRYICEFCNEGEQRFQPLAAEKTASSMFPHKCTKCGKGMMLPRVYPYIEWIPIDEG